MILEGVVWALIATTQAGNVSFSSGYPNESVCLDAKSIAETGYTVSENKEREARREAAEKAEVAKFEQDHPPRAATEQDRKVCATPEKPWQGITSSPSCEIDKYGVVRFSPGLGTTTVGFTSFNEIKYARCIRVPKGKR